MRLALCFSALVALSACDALDANAGLNLGEFEASVRGALDLDIHGNAASHSFSDPARFTVGLGLRGNFAGYVSFEVDGVERAEGTYAVGKGAGEVQVVYDVDTRTDQEFTASTGTLTIREVLEDDVTGSFAFDAVDADGARVSVEGTFRASRTDA